ncbi:hypothetical protein HV819_07740 [Anaerococcus sp. AGMB00486]|uniref:Uncharacterized protein n=1 Tax=Anaerococcus faecalis TaxID=2742993 RepID=A0ABX2NB00_9FIRM|nr:MULTISPECIES: hypothetical protein [Anaerococcus]MDD6920469.1 hypothetical protein [Eubacteriales bacterium]MDY3007003.1 hypothetical protein [Anaerococcus porci]MDY6127735.1 hypothetical protein [Anaerococcus sp.]NVF11869.1 hypothetical protein [Anaerococcus faecalis]
MKLKQKSEITDEEVIKNFQDRCNSQTSYGKLTEEDKKEIERRSKKIEEYRKKMNKEK